MLVVYDIFKSKNDFVVSIQYFKNARLQWQKCQSKWHNSQRIRITTLMCKEGNKICLQ